MAEYVHSIDPYHFISPDVNGEPKRNYRAAIQEVVVFQRQPEIRVWGNGEKPVDEAMHESLQQMSDEDRLAWVRYQIDLARKFDGPGGP